MPQLEDFLPYELGYLTPEMEKVAKQELHETEEKRKTCLEELRKLLKDDKNLYVRTDDNFLLAFLRGRKFNVERAFTTIQKFYCLRAELNHIGTTDDNQEVHHVFKKNHVGFLPHRDMSGRVILVIKLGMWDPEEVPRDLTIWTLAHCFLFSLEDPSTQVLGYSLILDLNGFGRQHLMQCTVENMKLLIHATQSCFPGCFKEVHVIRAPKLFSLAYAIAYPFIPSKLKRRIFLHGSDLKYLHSKIPPCILPSDFGGELGPFDNKQWHNLLLASNEFCLEQRLYGYR